MPNLRRLFFPGLLMLLCPGVAAAQPLGAEVDGVLIATETIVEGLHEPVFLTAPRGDKRLFVLYQTGLIVIVADGVVQKEPFLDLRDQVSTGYEQGLLGLAFHPKYATNGRFFINYTDRAGDTQVVAYQVSSDPNVALASSAATLLSIKQPYANHNGGWLGFGPDNYLYIATGDGGAGGDPHGNGQNLNALLGKILRIDVDSGSPYAIPPTNPFAKGGGAPEIFIYGARNPWRPSFDGDDLYVADVGQEKWEELSVVTTADGGANLGWNTMEGQKCYRPLVNCEQTNLVRPIYVYSHADGCSITGGYVYRGKAISELDGRYFFGDYCAGDLLSLRYENGRAEKFVDLGEHMGSIGSISSFGVDGDGEIYVLLAHGALVKIVRAP